ncbi:MAG: YCF48-related protein, partial [Cyclobacteriaceae bacterium]
QAQWSQLSGPPGGTMVDLERTASGKIYTVSNQTLFESSNNGASWIQTTITTPATNFRLDDIAVDATGSKLYAINFAVLYSSTDGTNWTKVSTDGQFFGMYRIKPFGPDGFIAISGWNGVYVSKDAGVSWTKILDDDLYDQYRLITNAAGDLFAPTRFGIKRYLYPGTAGTFSSANWENVYPLPLTNNIYDVTLGIDGSNNLFAQAAYDDGVYVNEILGSSSANNGAVSTWTPLLRSGLPNNNFSGSWARNGSRIYFLNNDARKIYSNNSQASTTFSLTGANYSINDNYITVTNIGALKLGDRISGPGIPTGAYVTDIYAANDFRISKNATASGTSTTLTVATLTTPWTVVDSPSKQYGANMSNIVFVSASNFVVGTDADGIFYTTNTGASFNQSSGLIFGNGSQVEVANTTGRIIYLANYSSSGYWTSTNNGTSWTFAPLASYVRKVMKLSNGTLMLYGDRIYRSTDNGANFTEVSPNYTNFISEHPTTPGRLYAANCCNLFLSTDGGQNWGSAITLTGMPTNFSFEQITVSDADVVYTVLYDQSDQKHHAYKIEAGVGTELPNSPWIDLEYFYPNNIFIQAGNLYISSQDAIYRTSNEGGSWITNNFSGSYVFPITQGGYSGIAISRYGTLYVTQDDGKTFNSEALPTSNSFVTDIALDLSGNVIASASNSPALKYTGSLTVDPATLPPFIDFDWQPTNGPFGGYTPTVLKDNSGKVWANTNGRLYATNTFTSWQKVPVLDQFG